MDYTWITEPPVEVIEDPDKVQVICHQFKAEARRFERPATDEKAVWRDRMNWAVNGANLTKAYAQNEQFRSQYTFCAYRPSSTVVGLMCWDRCGDSDGVARTLTMLPGRESEAAILIEYAVNLSEKAGYEGRVFFPHFISTIRRYRQLWVQYLRSEYVTPGNETDAWVKIDGKWRLVRYLQNHQVNLPQVNVCLLG